VPAGEIEQFVVDEIKAIRREPALVAATLAQTRRLSSDTIKRLKAERAALERQRRADVPELGRLSAAGAKNGDLARPSQVQERIDLTDGRWSEIENELARLVAQDISEEQVAAALGEFDTVWAALTPKEQARVLALLIERADHDGVSGNITITFRTLGLKSFAGAIPNQEETAA
jgi:site-specific DNA recombinase